ncbi:hypothetical protein [Saccharothrix sp. ST-888]|uniref:hypothetical protein n=1 Tax=Saccharothrix sp. ST-888 TaxID=1427391 RepID=UPI0005EC4EF1|nr:hypothetical protein [Saccharothrix sp. ST-888]KJK58340.1 hypothetical protein UK12_11155 [Saccharothrix sp. ST-888]
MFKRKDSSGPKPTGSPSTDGSAFGRALMGITGPDLDAQAKRRDSQRRAAEPLLREEDDD